MAEIYEILNELEISYRELQHEPVYTVEQAAEVRKQFDLQGYGCKNLFLRDKGKKYYLLIMSPDKRADLKVVASSLLLRRLSFASAEELQEILQLMPGGVSPFGLIHDFSHQVTVLLDQALQGQQLVFHPNTTTKSLSLSYEDFMRFLKWTGNPVLYWQAN